MQHYSSIYKKSKKKQKSAKKGISFLAFVWLFSFAMIVWLGCTLYGLKNMSGIAGKETYNFLLKYFGSTAYFIPLFLFYWLYRSIKNRTLAIFTLLLGVCLTLGSLGGEIAFLKTLFEKSSFKAGIIGQMLFDFIASFAGNAGGAIFCFAGIILGVHILFAIPWVATIRKTGEILKNDFISWMQARAEFKTQVEEAKAKEKAKEESSSKAEPRRVVAEESQDSKEEQKSMPKISRPVAKMVQLPPRKQEQKTEETKESSSEETKEKKEFVLPPLDLLREPSQNNIIGPSDSEIAESTKKLEETLKSFDIDASVTGVAPGPVVTRYEIKPGPGVKISSIVSISNDIALAMKARGIRVEAPIPGKDAVGFEIPNDKPVMVTMREILQDPAFINSKYKTTVALGRYAQGDAAVSVLEKMPHVLIAGATNSGKSICVHSMIVSLLYRAKPDEIKFLLVDPKRVELTLYEGIPHLYDPKVSCEDVNVVKDAQGAVKSLQALVKVMEKRMKIFEIAKVKNIESYNAWAEQNNEEKAFYIVVIIDEMADLMLQTKAAIEDSIQRLAQMGRALGIHLVLCTQRPSTNVITGVIKANLPSRIALQVTSKIDSRVVLDANGADTLLGKGDMLYLGISDPKPKRIQGAYISEEEITKVADFLRAQGGPDYPIQVPPEQTQDGMRPTQGIGTSREEMLQALNLIMQRRRVSQDILKANFGSSARASNILSVLEMRGFISKPEGTNRWEIHYDLIEQELQTLQNSPAEEEYESVYK